MKEGKRDLREKSLSHRGKQKDTTAVQYQVYPNLSTPFSPYHTSGSQTIMYTFVFYDTTITVKFKRVIWNDVYYLKFVLTPHMSQLENVLTSILFDYICIYQLNIKIYNISNI